MSIFSNIFGSNNKKLINDFSALGTDMHSHILPGIDDGAKTIDDSIKMIKGLQNLGYKKIITSPHVMGDFYKNSTDTIKNGLETVRNALAQQNIDVEIDAVAEYYLDENFIDLIKKRDLLTFGKNYVLFELSYINKYTDVLGVVFDLKMAGYKPVLAHPERYNYMHDNFKEYEELYDFEVYFQLNLATFAGHYGPQSKEIAYKLMRNNMVDFIGTDAHHNGHIRLYDKCLNDKKLKELLDSGTLKNVKL